MNSYEQKQQDRKTRLEQQAASLQSKSNAVYETARARVQAIPLGQPILVDHYSANRDRKYREQNHRMYGKAFALSDAAQECTRKAEAVGTGGISSDDPDAIEKLREQFAQVQKAQDVMKAANKIVRGKKDEAAKVAALVDLGLTAEQAQELLKGDFCGRVGFPSYALQNNNANGARIQKRIAELEARQSRSNIEHQGNGYTYREDVEDNRVQFLFDGKPDEETRAVLKRHAFKWSPSRGAWVRQLNNAGIYAAAQVRKALDAQASQ